MRTRGPPPPLLTVPSVTSEYCVAGGAMLQAPERLWPQSFPTATPPVLRKPAKPGSGYQRSPSSIGSSTPTKSDEAQVPDETGLPPPDHAPMRASVRVSPAGQASIPAVPPERTTGSTPVL